MDVSGDEEKKEAREVARRRLLFRSAHRGVQEMDLLLGRFAAAHLARFDDAQLDSWAALLDESDPDLWGWITGTVPVPERWRGSDVLRLLREGMPR